MSIDVNQLSLNNLVIFESAGRLGGFTRAAEELGISQPAVSHAIRLLETELGSVLFDRRNRGVFPTQQGRFLLEQVSTGLTLIHQSLREVRLMNVEHQVSIAVSTATATWWLLPRIARFKKLHPRIELRCITTDRDLDLSRERIDLAITLGSGSVGNYQSWHFVDEEVYPVCSPKLMKESAGMKDVKSLTRVPLLHLEERYKSRINWEQWMGHFGVRLRRDQVMFRFNDYSIVLQAAIEGQGVAQGWRHIVEPLIAQGLLVRPLEQSVTTNHPFFIIAPKDRELRSDVAYLKNWLVAEAGSGK
ncbi:MAG: LysR family transcriptional regulator [Comamonadaceae bacterium]|nr:MAG: LysR family transcriptional regulator [Comamonadaceae bacterium]